MAGVFTEDGRRLALPIGVSEFRKVEGERYYVDKTLLVRDLIDDGADTLLITRPRRFGKSLAMDMLRCFFEIPEPGDDTAQLFRGLKICACGDRYTSHQGRHPVVALSLKGCRSDSWEQTLEQVAALVRRECFRVWRLVDPAACDADDLGSLERLKRGEASPADLLSSLRTLTRALRKSTGEGTVVLIDEYDAPILHASDRGFYREATDFFRVFFGEGMKDNPDLYKGVMTGVLRVAKEGMFSGFNNPEVYTVLDDAYSEHFGFTPGEVRELLEYYGAAEKYPEVCDWYDGYRFGGSDVFNPWSVLKYVKGGCEPGPYWVNTSENAALRQIVATAPASVIDEVRCLYEGGSVTSSVDVGTVLPRAGEDPSSVWSFLLMAGYLKASALPHGEFGIDERLYELRIPNREVRVAYRSEVLAAFEGVLPAWALNPVSRALIAGDDEALRAAFAEVLRLASVRDAWGEAFYQGLTLALVAALDRWGYRVLSNREAGGGYLDIGLDPQGSGRPGVVVELKAAMAATSAEGLEALSREALEQIAGRDYACDMRERGVAPILAYGVAFCGRDVAVAVG